MEGILLVRVWGDPIPRGGGGGVGVVRRGNRGPHVAPNLTVDCQVKHPTVRLWCNVVRPNATSCNIAKHG